MAVSAGLSVSELNAEMIVETAIVTANCRKNCPVMPLNEGARHENGAEHQSDGNHRPGDLLHARRIVASRGDIPCSI